MHATLTPYAWSKVSDQWGIACFFHQRAAYRTLPADFMYHIWPGPCGDGNGGVPPGKGAWELAQPCLAMGNFTRQAVCPTAPAAGGGGGALAVDNRGGLACFLRGSGCPAVRSTTATFQRLIAQFQHGGGAAPSSRSGGAPPPC